MRLNKSDLAWAAGLWEGEGSVGCYRKPDGTWQLQLQVSMTDFAPIARFAELFGGHPLGPYKRPDPYRRGLKAYYRTSFSGEEAIRVFRALEPWLFERRLWQGAKAIALWRAR